MNELSGRTAVVTGGASGIGRGMALGLAAEGMRVVVADLDRAGAEKVAAELGGGAFGLQVDVTSPESLEAAARRVAEEASGASLLCANAGVLAGVGHVSGFTRQDWEYTFSVNVHGQVNTVQAFLPQLRANAPEAHIVNTASLGGLVSVEGFPIAPYVASKYASVGYSECLRAELAPEGIGVSVLCPGMVLSNLSRTSAVQRPERFGHQEPPPDIGDLPESMESHVLQPEQVGPIVVRAIRANRLHILTHPESRPLVERRFQALLDDYDFAAGR